MFGVERTSQADRYFKPMILEKKGHANVSKNFPRNHINIRFMSQIRQKYDKFAPPYALPYRFYEDSPSDGAPDL